MTIEPFADQHAIIEAAQNRICEAEEQIFAALARIPRPPGSMTPEHHDEWDYSELAGAYTRYHQMGRWDVAGDASGGVRGDVALSVMQTETGALRDWCITLNGPDEVTAEEARRLAAALLDAAAALEASQGHHSDHDNHDHDHDDHRDDHHPGDPNRDDPDGGSLEASRSRRSDPRA